MSAWRLALLAAALSLPMAAHAAASPAVAGTLLTLLIMLVAAKLGGLVERMRQPAVLGELLMGILLGNLGLAGIAFFEKVEKDLVIEVFAQLGVTLLLFQIGLESSIEGMRKVGGRSMAVALLGVAIPFAFGFWLVGPWLLPGLPTNAYLFIGAALTATSVGITGRVFRDLNVMSTPEARIVLGAAVIDDVLGLIILAVVTAIATEGAVSPYTVARITAEAFLFLAAAVLLGRWSAPRVARFFALISTHPSMTFALLVSACLAFAYAAHAIGLAPIIGAFAAGLILKPAVFASYDSHALFAEVRTASASADPSTQAAIEATLSRHAQHALDDLMAPLGWFFVPIFFVFTGMQVKLETLTDPRLVGVALLLSLAAIAGKLAAGSVAGKVNRWVVGWGMVPRGEVGLIFAAIGKQLGVVSESVFSVIVIMVIITTLVTPGALGAALRRHERRPGD
jgi:Kef-type K+ transport system membrane component KefB